MWDHPHTVGKPSEEAHTVEHLHHRHLMSRPRLPRRVLDVDGRVYERLQKSTSARRVLPQRHPNIGAIDSIPISFAGHAPESGILGHNKLTREVTPYSIQLVKQIRYGQIPIVVPSHVKVNTHE